MKKGGKIKRERETERERDRLFFQTPNFYVFFKKNVFFIWKLDCRAQSRAINPYLRKIETDSDGCSVVEMSGCWLSCSPEPRSR